MLAADLQPLHASNRFVKFADDTYLVVPAVNADSRAAELDNIVPWATASNLKLNKLKTKEVVLYDSRRLHKVSPPLPLPDVDRVNTLKVLGVTLNNYMSASDWSEHIHNVLSGSAQTLHALRVLRHHGLDETGLQGSCGVYTVSQKNM